MQYFFILVDLGIVDFFFFYFISSVKVRLIGQFSNDQMQNYPIIFLFLSLQVILFIIQSLRDFMVKIHQLD